jgi:hypothetical protein
VTDEAWRGKGSGDRLRGAEAKKRRDEALRSIYGTRVKIPPPGPERDAMISSVAEHLTAKPTESELAIVRSVIDALEELEG